MTDFISAKQPVVLRVLGALSVALLLLAGCANTSPPPGVSPVSPFDVNRYQGRWYELARLDHSFERGMTDVSATYTPRSDGSIRVLNRGFNTANDRWQAVTGKALFTGSPAVASLKVSFFGPFYGGYHVAAIDPDYRWALVVGPNTSYCWILAREKHLGASEMKRIVARAQALGVDTASLVWVTHDRVDPTE